MNDELGGKQKFFEKTRDNIIYAPFNNVLSFSWLKFGPKTLFIAHTKFHTTKLFFPVFLSIFNVFAFGFHAQLTRFRLQSYCDNCAPMSAHFKDYF